MNFSSIRTSWWHGFCNISLYTQERRWVMKEKEMIKKIAKLETVNDQLAAEIHYLEQLTRALGFAEGLKTLKAAALEMLESDYKKGKPSN
jgi:hypothetical protein